MKQVMSTIHVKDSPEYRLLQMTVLTLNMLPYCFAMIVRGKLF